MAKRTATAKWRGTMMEGDGTVALGTGAFEGPYTFKSRMGDGEGTNPEELMAASHAGCFTMTLSYLLGEAGHPAESLETLANVHVRAGESGPEIPKIELTLRGRVPGMSEDDFVKHAETAKVSCPVSKALASVREITLDAALSD